MKKPDDCKDKNEIRCAIDALDKEIIDLLSVRFGYVKAIVKYKETNKKSIVAQDRYDEVIQSRRKWATQKGLDPDVVEKMYIILLDHFIKEELNLIGSKNNQ
jgi:isochorismate pyruvate lyase